jgi:predicted GTPase
LVDDELRKMVEKDLKKKLKAESNVTLLFISAATNYHLDKLKDEIMKKLG